LSAETPPAQETTQAVSESASGRPTYVFWIIPAVIIILDQATKWAVVASLSLYQSVSVFGDWFRLTYILNPGGAFGVRWDNQAFYFTAASLVIVWVIWHLWRHGSSRRLSNWALALILGGAIGNFIDRIIVGQVIDFVDVEFPNIRIPAFDFGVISHPGVLMDRWPTFNVADSAVTVGVIILIVTLFYDPVLRRRPSPVGPSATREGHSGVEAAPQSN